MLKIGTIGHGYWGPNLVRNFSATPGVQVKIVCDRSPDALKSAQLNFPFVECTTDVSALVRSTEIDAVAIATPISSHFELAKAALENGKHVFIEKPFTKTSDEAKRLIELAGKKGLTIMVDHTFLFTGAVRKIKELVAAGELGDLYYYDSTRVNLGLLQHDVNVIWDLAPHDFSILDYVTGRKVQAISATGFDHFGRQIENIAHVSAQLENNMVAYFNLNWLSPVKIRQTLIGGSRKMLVWDDLNPSEKIKIYDTGVEVKTREGIYDRMFSYRSGDMWSPKVAATEALKLEAEYFRDCVLNKTVPLNDGQAGLRIVRMLEASEESLRRESVRINL